MFWHLLCRGSLSDWVEAVWHSWSWRNRTELRRNRTELRRNRTELRRNRTELRRNRMELRRNRTELQSSESPLDPVDTESTKMDSSFGLAGLTSSPKKRIRVECRCGSDSCRKYLF
ncbi:Histone-lysine N-methyltransferase SUV39H1 [Takifugu flavidus]|uniref:Histone-lysine N-methyltransferase SUV39H1 n=1 Tax=Takifugu flavidus TaxID=433684 RepID=A0A5C6MQN9_9TELE|nr:Histone-lysine N-methyltransferase SUV39H1 [Takifugu flavidus]